MNLQINSLNVDIYSDHLHVTGYLINIYSEKEELDFKLKIGSTIKYHRYNSYESATILKFNKKNILVENVKTKKTKSLSYKDVITRNRYQDVFVRLEKDGTGPFRNQEAYQLIKESPHFEDSFYRLPTPQRDSTLSCYPLLTDKKGVLFACTSLDELHQWFPKPLLEKLLAMGFSIKKYQKNYDFYDYIRGSNQVAIIPSQEEYQEIINHYSSSYSSPYCF